MCEQCKERKKYVWNGTQDEVIEAKTVDMLKEMLACVDVDKRTL